MAITKVPTDWIASYSSDGTNITIPIASLTGLSSAEANTTTGDIKNILYSILDTLYTEYNNTLAADRSATMVLSKGVSVDLTGTVATVTFRGKFTCALPTMGVTDDV